MNELLTYTKVVAAGNPETALAAGDLPASGSYVDVTGFEYVTILVHLGAIAASDAPTFEVKVSDAVNGTADSLSPAITHTSADDDDGEFISFTIQTANLPVDHHFMTVTAGGTITTSFASVVYLLSNARHQPVTQSATFPTASQYTLAG